MNHETIQNLANARTLKKKFVTLAATRTTYVNQDSYLPGKA